MENCSLNDEEQKIMSDLDGLPEAEKLKILEDSMDDEVDDSGRRILRFLIWKLKTADRRDRG